MNNQQAVFESHVHLCEPNTNQPGLMNYYKGY